MLYPSQVVDGVVHSLGGKALREMCEAVPARGEDAAGQPLRCDVGGVAVTSAPGFLTDLNLDLIAHAVPPFWSDSDWEERLRSCYRQSLIELCRHAQDSTLHVAAPVLGAGARGAPEHEAARVATDELCKLLLHEGSHATARGPRPGT